MSDKDWLESLKPGDLVVVERPPLDETLMTVDRLTKTQIVTNTGRRFNRQSGRSVGTSTYGHSWVKRPNPEVVGRINRKGMLLNLKHHDWDALTTEQLGEVIALLKSFEKEQG